MRKRNYYVKTDRRIDIIKGKGRKAIIIIAVSAAVLYLLATSILGEMGLVKYYRMKAQHQYLADEITRLKQDNVRLMREVRSLKTDPAYIERLARDKLGLSRPGEIVYYYGDSAMR